MRIHDLAKRHEIKPKRVLDALRGLGDRHFDALSQWSEMPMQPLEMAAFEDAFLGGHIHSPRMWLVHAEYGDYETLHTICECGLAIVGSEDGGYSDHVELEAWFNDILERGGVRKEGHFTDFGMEVYETIAQTVARDLQPDGTVVPFRNN